MNKHEIFRFIDHTLLKQNAVWEQIREICQEGMDFGTASVCIPPSFVKQAAEFVGERLPICTVIGFPNGYQTTAVKVFEAAEAVQNGAAEIVRLADWDTTTSNIFAKRRYGLCRAYRKRDC